MTKDESRHSGFFRHWRVIPGAWQPAADIALLLLSALEKTIQVNFLDQKKRNVTFATQVPNERTISGIHAHRKIEIPRMDEAATSRPHRRKEKRKGVTLSWSRAQHSENFRTEVMGLSAVGGSGQKTVNGSLEFSRGHVTVRAW